MRAKQLLSLKGFGLVTFAGLGIAAGMELISRASLGLSLANREVFGESTVQIWPVNALSQKVQMPWHPSL